MIRVYCNDSYCATCRLTANVHCATWTDDLKTGHCSKTSRRLRNYTSTSVLKKNNKKLLIASSCNNNDWVSVTRLPITRPEETSHNSTSHSTQVSTRTRTHITFQTCFNHCRDLSHHNSWTFVPNHPTISFLTFRSHSPSVDVCAYDVSILDQCCVLIVRRRKNLTKLKCVVAWLEYTIEFDNLVFFCFCLSFFRSFPCLSFFFLCFFFIFFFLLLFFILVFSSSSLRAHVQNRNTMIEWSLLSISELSSSNKQSSSESFACCQLVDPHVGSGAQKVTYVTEQ